MVALEQMIQDEQERAIALDAMADEIRARMCTRLRTILTPRARSRRPAPVSA